MSRHCEGILVLAGNVDPCEDIGAALHFNFVPFPYDQQNLFDVVENIIACEICSKQQFIRQARAQSAWDFELEASRRDVGLRAWLFKTTNAAIADLATGVSKNDITNKAVKAATHIDQVVLNVFPLVFIWPDDNPRNVRAVEKFESMLHDMYKVF